MQMWTGAEFQGVGVVEKVTGRRFAGCVWVKRVVGRGFEGDACEVTRMPEGDRTDEMGRVGQGFKTLSQIFRFFGNF